MAREGTDFAGPDLTYTPAVDGAASRALVATPTYPAPAPAFGAPTLHGPEILYAGFDQTWLANCLRRRWLMAGLLGLLAGLAAAALLLWCFPTVSNVTAYLQVKSSAEDVFVDTKAPRLSPTEIERQAQNHLALLKSPMVLESALQDQAIAGLDAIRNQGDEALLWLTDELRVSFPGDGEILEVRYEGEEDPDQMVKVVDAVVKAYQNNVLMKDRLQSVATQQDLALVLESTKKDQEEKMAKYKARLEFLGVSSEEIQIPQLQGEIRNLESQIIVVKKELVDIEVMKELAIQNSKAPTAVNAAVAEAMDKDPTVAMYKQQIFEAEQAYQQRASSTRNKQDAQLKRLEAQIAQMKQALDQYSIRAEKELRDKIAQMPDDGLRAAITEYKIRYEMATKSLKEYEEQLAKATDKLLALGTQDPEIQMLQQAIENQFEIIKSLEQKVLSWDVLRQARDRQDATQQQSDLEKVTVIQSAKALPFVNTVERWSIAGVGGVAALGLTCYGIALMEFRRRRLNSPTNVDEGLGVRVLGVLPPATLKSIAGNSLVATQVAESIDNVRATLMHDSTSAPRQVVMITSSGSQEGATVVASSLALSLARAGRRTLLVDADLRSPSLHKLFGMPMEDGLCEILRSETDLADAIRPTNNEGLYLLTAGICSHYAIDALATDQPQVIFEKLRDQFDFVVIDAPPVLGISDTLSLGQYVDGAILAVLRDESEIRKIYKATELLRHMGIRLIGSVVNGVPLKADRRVVRLHQAATARPMPQLAAKAEV
ncbi:MAG: polysaccharide biosynthesis tyrosine autokinase [Pirellulales bacterium]|nr:polysaccharide biosynthesis tyrosine autokinase [Pirellulales bacterium]